MSKFAIGDRVGNATDDHEGGVVVGVFSTDDGNFRYAVDMEGYGALEFVTDEKASRSLQSICKDMNFVIRFGRIGCGGGNHGCEGHFGKEVCCAAER